MATNENELRELSERIVRLGGRDQARLLEMVLAENRRLSEEAHARALTEEAEFRAAAKRELAAMEEWHLQRQRSAVPVEERAREAG